MRKRLGYIIDNHKFFVKESPSYMQGTNRIKYYLRYPRAYCYFMWWIIGDMFKQNTTS